MFVHNSWMLQDAAAELKIELQSSELRKELRVTDLVFTQVLGIVGLGWIGTAGKLGSHQLMFWLAAIFLFYLPSAVVVIHLNNEMPLEGGLYQWAKLRFNEITGFLVAWNLWIYCVVMVSQVGLIVANNLSYAMGEPWIANSKPAMIGVSVVTIIGLVFVARVGFSVGRWVQGLCGFMLVALFVAMAVFALPRWFLKGAAHPPLALSLPTLTLINLNILSKIGFGALGGFDTIAMFAGECRASDAGATIRRSMWIATPVIAGAFVIGTACLLVFVKPEEIDLISPITQVLSRGMEFAGFSGSMAAIATALIVCTWLGAALLNINYASRLPMVAGWDHLLPEWCMRLHPEYRTPVGSIVFLGSVSTLCNKYFLLILVLLFLPN